MGTASYLENPLGHNDNELILKTTAEDMLQDMDQESITSPTFPENEDDNRESGNGKQFWREGHESIAEFEHDQIVGDKDTEEAPELETDTRVHYADMHEITLDKPEVDIMAAIQNENVISLSLNSPANTCLRLLRSTQPCPICKKTFSSVKRLESHVREWHQHDRDKVKGVDSDSCSENDKFSHEATAIPEPDIGVTAETENGMQPDVQNSECDSDSSSDSDNYYNSDDDYDDEDEQDAETVSSSESHSVPFTPNQRDSQTVAKKAKDPGPGRKMYSWKNLTPAIIIKLKGNPTRHRFQCPSCKAQFATNFNYKRHYLSHHTNKSNFKQKNNLLRHQRFTGRRQSVVSTHSRHSETKIQAGSSLSKPQRHGDDEKVSIIVGEQVEFNHNASEKVLTNPASAPANSIQSDDAVAIKTVKVRCLYSYKNLTPAIIIKLKGDPSSRKFKCPSCGAQFGYNSEYKRHYLSHHTKIRFKCEICNHKFKYKGDLLTHQRSTRCRHSLPDPHSKPPSEGYDNCPASQASLPAVAEEMDNLQDVKSIVETNEHHVSDPKLDLQEISPVASSSPRLRPRPGHQCPQTFSTAGKLEEHAGSPEKEKRTSTLTKPDAVGENSEVHDDSEADMDCNVPDSDSSYLEPEAWSLKLQISCEVANCKSVFYSEDDYKKHKKFHELVPCNFCDSVKIPAVDLPWHEISEHSSDPSRLQLARPLYPCPRPVCSYSSRYKKNYIRHHLQQHQNLNPNELNHTTTCEICGMIYASVTGPRWPQKLLQEHHENAHNLKNLKGSDTPFRCDQDGCQAYFLQSGQLSLHKTDAHQIRKCFTCSECNAGFKVRHRFHKHMGKHHPEKLNYPCTISGCTYRTDSKTGLEAHVRVTHRKLPMEPMSCIECKRTFWTKTSLQNHMITHSPNKNKHICEHCGKNFKNVVRLRTHVLSHSGPESWEFECCVCSKKCSTKQNLKKHEKTHGHEKSFVCELCGLNYIHAHGLRRHVRSKHGDQGKKNNETALGN